MNTPFAVRLATHDDIEVLYSLELEFDNYYESYNFDVQYGRVKSELIPKKFYSDSLYESFNNSDSRIFVAEIDGKIIGSSIVVKEEKKPKELYSVGYVGHIESIFVSEGYRGAGAGKALIDNMISWLRSEGVTICTLSVLERNIDALRLYETLGFEKERIKMYKII